MSAWVCQDITFLGTCLFYAFFPAYSSCRVGTLPSLLALWVTADGTKLSTRPEMIPLGVRVTFDSPSVSAAPAKVFVNMDDIEQAALCLVCGKGKGSRELHKRSGTQSRARLGGREVPEGASALPLGHPDYPLLRHPCFSLHLLSRKSHRSELCFLFKNHLDQ